MKIVIKIGGSVCTGDFGPDFSYFSRLTPVLRKIMKENQLIVAIGGGSLTRKYGKTIEEFDLSDEEREKIFIELIKANVLLVSSLLKLRPLLSVDEIKPNTSGVIGGIAPGRSTDANAAIAAEKIGADIFIKMTDVDGIYTKDPKKHNTSRKLDQIPFDYLSKLAVKGRPNNYGVLDALAVRTLSSAKIKTVIINGKDPRNLEKALNGDPVGTLITA